jgi:hypothetical protein
MDLKRVDRGYHPDTPTPGELAALRPGDTVRLALATGARFWCRLLEGRRQGCSYVGVAEDTVPPVRRGDRVCFESSHIFAVIAPGRPPGGIDHCSDGNGSDGLERAPRRAGIGDGR